MKVTNYTTMTVYDRDGNEVYPQIQDRNGNYYSQDSNGNLIDTLDHTPLLVSSSGNQIYYDVLTYNGLRARYTVTTETINYSTSFGQSGVSEASGSFTAIQSIQLPDGSMYSFNYGSGTSPGNYGELTSITLPTGGTIQFTWQNFLDSFQNENRWLASKLEDGGTTSFAPSTISQCSSTSSCQEKTVVTSPAGNDTVYAFTLDSENYKDAGKSWNTSTVAYQGSSNGGTALKSVQTAYTYTTGQLAAGDYYNTPSSYTTTTSLLDIGLSMQTVTTLDNSGSLPAQVNEWDYYSTSSGPPGTPTKETSYTYYSGTSLPTQVSVTDGSGNQLSLTDYSYDQTTPTATSGVPSHSTGTNFGNLTTEQQYFASGSSITTTFAYDDTGALSSESGPNGTTTYGHDSTDTFVTSVTPPTPSSGVSLPTTAAYDESTGRVTSTTDPNDNTTYYKNYDAFGRVGEIDYPDGGKTTFSYTPTQISEHQYENASTYTDTETLYDGYGRVSRVAYGNALGNSTPYYQHDTCYDSSGRVQFQSYAYEGAGWGTPKVCSGAGDQYAYDALSRVTEIEHGDGTSITNTYRGRATETNDENGHQRIVQNDAFGRITSVCEITSDSSMPGSGAPASCGLDVSGTGFLTTYTYNLPSHQTTITQGVQTRIFQTDWLGRSILTNEPESGQTTYSYSYSSTGLVVTRTRPEANQTNANVTTTMTTQYDKVGRVVSISYSDGTPAKSFTYDASVDWSNFSQSNIKGHLSNVFASTSLNGTGTTFSYDAMGRITGLSECLPSGCGTGADDKHLAYSYDWLGDLLSSSNGAGVTISYSYSAAAQLDGITSSLGDSLHPGTLISAVQYGSFGPTTWQLGNGLSDVRIYDGNGRNSGGWLCNGSSQAYCTGGAQIYGYTNTWNGDQITGVCDTVLNQCAGLGYDAFGRLSSRTVNSGTAQGFSYAYDRWGNRWQQNVTAGSGPSPSLSFDTANNHITTPGYTYDAAGNMTSDGIHTYTYDADGNQVSVDGGNTATYTYNALNQRVRIDTPGSDSEEFVYNAQGQHVSGWNNNGAGWLVGWIYWGARQIAIYDNGVTYFDHTDWEGTERLRTQYNGSVDGTFASLPFGDGYTVASGEDIDPRHFAGLDQDNSANEHAKYREYSNMAGRWMSPDPYSGSYDSSNPQSFNRYSYVMNNPLAFTDSTGLQCSPVLGGRMLYCDSSEGPGDDGGGFLSFIEGIGEGIAEAFGAFGPPQFHGSLTPRPNAPNNNPCANSTLSAAGVTAQGQIATAQGFIAAGQVGANSSPYANPVLGFFGGMFGYYEAVHTGGPNDIKNQPGPGYHDQVGVDAGNISFGITCPYGAGFCQFAAGFAQTFSGDPNFNGTLSTGFDTPSDNASIQQGQAMRAAGCHE